MRHYLDHCTNNEAEYHALIEGLRVRARQGECTCACTCACSHQRPGGGRGGAGACTTQPARGRQAVQITRRLYIGHHHDPCLQHTVCGRHQRFLACVCARMPARNQSWLHLGQAMLGRHGCCAALHAFMWPWQP